MRLICYYLPVVLAVAGIPNCIDGAFSSNDFQRQGPEANRSAVSIGAFGSVADGTTDNHNAIQAAFDYASAHGVGVAIPAGTFAYSGTLTANGIKVSGVGDSSVLKALNPYNEALFVTGDGGSVSSLRIIDNNSAGRLSTPQAGGIELNGATHFLVQNVHISGEGIGALNNSAYGQIINNTVENTLADSITMLNGAHDIVVENNRIVHSGDDGISVVGYGTTNLPYNITIQGNTVLYNNWGRGITVSGADHVNVIGNHIEGGVADRAGILISSGEWYTGSDSNITVSGNTLIDAGGAISGQGAITVYNAVGGTHTITNLTIDNNQIVKPRAAGIWFVGQGVEQAAVQNNTLYTDNHTFISQSDPTAAITASGNQTFSLAAYTTPLVPAGGGVGTSTSTPTPTPTPAPVSADGTIVMGTSGQIVSDAHNVFAINAAKQITENGTVMPLTANVTELAYLNHTLYQEATTQNLWWSFNESTNTWTQTGNPLTPSPDGTIVTGTSGAIISDAHNVFAINAAKQITENGTVMPITANVTELAYLNHTLYQEATTQNLWWSFNESTNAWTQTGNPLSTPTSTPALAPTLSVQAASGNEDTAIPLTIAAAQSDSHLSSANLSVTVSGLQGASLNHGTLNADGSYTLHAGDLQGLALTPAPEFSGTVALSVTATDGEPSSNTSASSAAQTLAVTVNAVAEAPSLSVQAASGNEGAAIPLAITAAQAEGDLAAANLSVTVAGLQGASLNHGILNADGSYTLHAADLQGLALTPPSQFTGSLALAVTATDTEPSSQTTANSAAQTLAVTVNMLPTLSDNAGHDIFVFSSPAQDGAQISNFNPAQDMLDVAPLLKALGYTGSDPLQDHVLTLAQMGTNSTAVMVDPTGQDPSHGATLVTLQHVAPSDIHAGNLWV